MRKFKANLSQDKRALANKLANGLGGQSLSPTKDLTDVTEKFPSGKSLHSNKQHPYLTRKQSPRKGLNNEPQNKALTKNEQHVNSTDKHQQICLKTPEETVNDSQLQKKKQGSISSHSSLKDSLRNRQTKQSMYIKNSQDNQNEFNSTGQSFMDSMIINSKNIHIIDQTKQQQKLRETASKKTDMDYFAQGVQTHFPKVMAESINVLSTVKQNTAKNSNKTFVNQLSMPNKPSNGMKLTVNLQKDLYRIPDSATQQYFSFQGSPVFERVNTGDKKLNNVNRNSMFNSSVKMEKYLEAPSVKNNSRRVPLINKDLAEDLNKDSSTRYNGAGRESSIISSMNQNQAEGLNKTLKSCNPLNVSSRQDMDRFQESETRYSKKQNNVTKNGQDTLLTLQNTSQSEDLFSPLDSNPNLHSKKNLQQKRIFENLQKNISQIQNATQQLRNSTNFTAITSDQDRKKDWFETTKNRVVNLRRSLMSPELNKTSPILDFEKIKSKQRVQHLPRIIDAQPQPQKEPRPPYEFRLPKQYKFTNNSDLVNVETIRQSIRINRFKHADFDQVQNSHEGKRYHDKIYTVNQPTYQTMNPEEIARRNKMLGYTKPLPKAGTTEKYELDQQKIKAIKSSRQGKDKQEVKEEVVAEKSKLQDNELKGKEIITKEQIEEMEKTREHRKVKADLEKDLFNLLFKFRKELKEEANKNQKKKKKGAALQEKLAALNKEPQINQKKETKTEEQLQQEHEIKEQIEKLQTINMYKQFGENLQLIDNGEFKVDLFKSKRIERMIKDEGMLSKCEPLNFKGSLHHFVSEINEYLEKGYEIDKKEMKNIIQQCDQKIKELQRVDSAAYLRSLRQKSFKRQKTRLVVSQMNSMYSLNQSPIGYSMNTSPMGQSTFQSSPRQLTQTFQNPSPNLKIPMERTLDNPVIPLKQNLNQEQLFQEEFDLAMTKLQLSEIEQQYILDKKNYLIKSQKLLIEQGVDKNTIGYVDPEADLTLQEIEDGLLMLQSQTIQTKLNMIKHEQENKKVKKFRVKVSLVAQDRQKKIDAYNRNLKKRQKKILENIKKIHIKYENIKNDETSEISSRSLSKKTKQNKDILIQRQGRGRTNSSIGNDLMDAILDDDSYGNMDQETSRVISARGLNQIANQYDFQSLSSHHQYGDIIVHDNDTTKDDQIKAVAEPQFSGCVIEPKKEVKKSIEFVTYQVDEPEKLITPVNNTASPEQVDDYDRMRVKTENSSQEEHDGDASTRFNHQQFIPNNTQFITDKSPKHAVERMEAQDEQIKEIIPTHTLFPQSEKTRGMNQTTGAWSNTDGIYGIFGIDLIDRGFNNHDASLIHPKPTKTSIMRQKITELQQRQNDKQEERTKLHANQYEILKLKYKLDHEKAMNSENLRNNVLRNKQLQSHSLQNSLKKPVVQQGRITYVDFEDQPFRLQLQKRETQNASVMQASSSRNLQNVGLQNQLNTIQQTASKLQLDVGYKDIDLTAPPSFRKKKKKPQNIDDGLVPDTDQEEEESESPQKSIESSESEDYHQKTVGYKSLCKQATSEYNQNLNFFDKKYQKVKKVDTVKIVYDDSVIKQLNEEELMLQQKQSSTTKNIRDLIKEEKFKEILQQRKKFIKKYKRLDKKIQHTKNTMSLTSN